MSMRFSLNNFGPVTRVAVTYEDTDASGERVLRTTEIRGAAVMQLERGLLASPRARLTAWRKNPLCIECGKRVARADQSGVLVVEGALRVAHKRPCFVKALAAVYPHLSSHIVRSRQEGTS